MGTPGSRLGLSDFLDTFVHISACELVCTELCFLAGDFFSYQGGGSPAEMGKDGRDGEPGGKNMASDLGSLVRDISEKGFVQGGWELWANTANGEQCFLLWGPSGTPGWMTVAAMGQASPLG